MAGIEPLAQPPPPSEDEDPPPRPPRWSQRYEEYDNTYRRQLAEDYPPEEYPQGLDALNIKHLPELTRATFGHEHTVQRSDSYSPSPEHSSRTPSSSATSSVGPLVQDPSPGGSPVPAQSPPLGPLTMVLWQPPPLPAAPPVGPVGTDWMRLGRPISREEITASGRDRHV